MSTCPACGEAPDLNVQACRPVRVLRFEAELLAAVKLACALALLLGLFSLVDGAYVFVHSGSLTETLLHGLIVVLAVGVMSAGVKMAAFQRMSRFYLSAGLLSLAFLSTCVHAVFSSPFVCFGSVSLSMLLLSLSALCLLPITARIFSPVYQLTIQPAIRHDRPVPWLPFVFWGYVLTAACLYFLVI